MQDESGVIICPRCRAENPAQRKTCQRCWGLLRGLICPHCGKRATRAGARYCEHCGEDLHAEPALPVPTQLPADPAPVERLDPPVAVDPSAVEPPAVELPASEPRAAVSAIVDEQPPALEPPAREHRPAAVEVSPEEPQTVSPERVVVMGLSRMPTPADSTKAGSPPGPRAAPARTARPQPPSPAFPRKPVGLLIAAAGLVIILGLAFLGGVALRRQQAASPRPETSPVPQAAATVAAAPAAAPAAPSAARTAQPVAGGTLRITTVPSGAQVELDGVAVGVTALTLNDVAPGRRAVRISRNGFKAETREIEVVAGETAALSLTLAVTPTPAVPRRRAPSGPPLPPPPLPPAPP